MYRGRRGDRDDNEKDTEQFRKLFIGGLSLSTTEEKLRSYFEQWGKLVDAVVMKDRQSNRSRGFGFVTFSEPDMVDAAQANRPHEIDGKTVETKRAMPREESNNPESHMTVSKIFVGGLRKEVVKEDLETYFSKFGHVTDTEIVCWKESGEPRGFGFVTYDDYDPVDKVILYKPHYINNNRVEVKKALSKEQINESKRKQDFDRAAPPMSRGGAMYERGRGSGFRDSMYSGNGHSGMGGASLMGFPDAFMGMMDRRFDDRMGGGFDDRMFGSSMMGPGAWQDLYERMMSMRDMEEMGQFGGDRRRMGGGPMRDGPSSYSRNAPYGRGFGGGGGGSRR